MDASWLGTASVRSRMFLFTMRAMALAAVVLFSTCTEDGVTPRAGSGLYRLVSLNGQAIPVSTPMSPGEGDITHGDLLLRPDGSFMLGMTDPLFAPGYLAPGHWDLDGEILRATFDYGTEFTGVLSGGYLTLDSGLYPGQPPERYRYEFQQVPVPEDREVRYVLTRMNGRSDEFSYEEPVLSGRTVEGTVTRRILFDTIVVRDGVFFERSRAESRRGVENSARFAGSVSVGSFVTGDSMLALWSYGPALFMAVPERDTLWFDSGLLKRRVFMGEFGGIQIVEDAEYTPVNR